MFLLSKINQKKKNNYTFVTDNKKKTTNFNQRIVNHLKMKLNFKKKLKFLIFFYNTGVAIYSKGITT